MKLIYKDKIKCVLDDCMRLGAALGSFRETTFPLRCYLSMAANAAFEAAQKVFIDELDSIFVEEKKDKETEETG